MFQSSVWVSVDQYYSLLLTFISSSISLSVADTSSAFQDDGLLFLIYPLVNLCVTICTYLYRKKHCYLSLCSRCIVGKAGSRFWTMNIEWTFFSTDCITCKVILWASTFYYVFCVTALTSAFPCFLCRETCWTSLKSWRIWPVWFMSRGMQ